MTSSEEIRTIVLPTVQPSGGGAGKKYRILVTAGPLEGREYVIHRFPYTIGSGLGNDLSIADSTVSRHHCELVQDETGALCINDLRSTNGTSIEGVRVSSARLTPNTLVQLGHTAIIVPLMQDHPEYTMSAREQFGNSIGRSPVIRHVFHLAEQAATSDVPVLILGESGTGKEELAGDIHNESTRKGAPFIVLDCNAFSDSEYAKREFFGSTRTKGALDLASGGTLFVDSIDRLPSEAQPLLLRAIETRKDVRFICATKEDAAALNDNDAFYQPLSCALSVLVIDLPPLRRRKDDIPLLLADICDRLHVKTELKAWCGQDSTLAFLKRYNWPGNIRELRTMVQKLQALDRIPADIGAFLQSTPKNDSPDAEAVDTGFSVSADRPFKDVKNEIIEEFERKYLSDLLARNAQNISLSARNAGIERTYLQRLIRKYGMRNVE